MVKYGYCSLLSAAILEKTGMVGLAHKIRVYFLKSDVMNGILVKKIGRKWNYEKITGLYERI